MYEMGIKINGDTIEVVVVDSNRKIKAVSENTIGHPTDFYNALQSIILQNKIDINTIDSIVISTDELFRTLLDREGLAKVAAFRLSLPASENIPPFSRCPKDFRGLLGKNWYMFRGGHEFDGSEIAPLDEEAIRKRVKEIQDTVDAIAITGAFAQINHQHEQRAKEIVKDISGKDYDVILSHEISGLGILERENATILNAMLLKPAYSFVNKMKSLLSKLDIKAKVYMVHNNGTRLPLEYAKTIPIQTIFGMHAAAIQAAGVLNDTNNAVVFYTCEKQIIGGVIENSNLRLTSANVEVAEIPLNIQVPDVVSIPYVLSDSMVENPKEVLKKIEKAVDMLKTSDNDLKIIIAGKHARELFDTIHHQFNVSLSEEYKNAGAYGIAIVKEA